MPLLQKKIVLQERPRGIYVITHEILQHLAPQIVQHQHGLLHLFLQHTSAALSINENADPDVRLDMAEHLDRLIPQHMHQYRHIAEGPDDMTSHILCSMLGNSLLIPFTDGKLALGIWQGIYLCEFRHNAGQRSVLATLTC
jgi:secondary thiamine-phosphate synthase enzyme